MYTTTTTTTDHFVFSFNRWKEEETRTPTWNEDINNTYWISSLDLDDRGSLIAYSAFEEEEDGTIVDSVKIVSYPNTDDANPEPVDVYERDFKGWSVDLSVSVSDQGNVAAFVASKLDVDDVNWWEVGFDYGDDIIGALSVLTKYEEDAGWSVIGKGTEAENLGVSGSKVYLSGDGSIAAVGYDTIVSLYGINLERPEVIDTTSTEQEDVKPANDDATNAIEVCTPFPNSTDDGGILGIIDDLPHTKEGDEDKQHTLSLALSNDGSVVAVGIDSFDGEDRGLVRTFAWSCEEGKYIRLGQKDLLGSHEFDGFGQSVDLSLDGKTLAVGANQPPPGKAGYVDVYNLHGNNWKLSHRIHDFPEDASDMGRDVKLSNDGEILLILGSIMSEDSDYDSSFVRVVRNENGKWMPMGNDILSSVQYDEYGISAHATLSGDGNTIAVTGSYGQFFAKLYEFNKAESTWEETVIPPPGCDDSENENDSDGDDYYYDDGFDYLYECYFSGDDISITADASFVAVAGTTFSSSGNEIGTIRVLTKDPVSGNFTVVGNNPIDFTDDYSVSSVDISDDGMHLAVGLNDHSDDLEGQGQSASFVWTTEASWASVGKVLGKNETDLLGARVRVTADGQLVAASSRKGYITFIGA